MKKGVLLFVCCLLTLYAVAQKQNANYRYHIKKTTSPIVVDGLMDDEAWAQAEVAKDFFMILPMDTSFAKQQTEVRMTYDDRNIYIIAINHDNAPGPNVIESLKRDFAFMKNDLFQVFLDPFDSRTDGFSFGVNAAGAQMDASQSDGGKEDMSWDNKWTSAVTQAPGRWVFEAAIPFTSIRYAKDSKEWGINFARNDLKTNEKSSWGPIPRQFPAHSLAYTGVLVWDQAPPSAGTNISIIPYVLGGVSKDYENNTSTSYRKDIGGDAKIAITSSLNLDLTVNPDFSQVDVDEQVVNLDRFELFLPEKRQFFLENGDLFSNFGYQDLRPFFSRRIGLNAPIRYGARLSGKLDKNWRIGLMNIQTGDVKEDDVSAQNYGVLTLQRRVFSRSSISLMVINKQATNALPTDLSDRYNRNVGLEYNLASSNNLWNGKALVMKSFSPDDNNGFVQAAHLEYESKVWNFFLEEQYVGQNYISEVGFIPRNGYIKISPRAGYNMFPTEGKVLSHGVRFSSEQFFDTKMNSTDNQSRLAYEFNFRNQSVLEMDVEHNYVKLMHPFDPTNSGKGFLAEGSKHRWSAIEVEYESSPQKVFTYAVEASYGGYYDDGRRIGISSELGYRFQPHVVIGLKTSFNDLRLPDPFGHTSFWLVGPRLDVSFTNTLYLTAFAQYNQQRDNMNLNTRLQWRYKPASDFFIVYGDNYDPTSSFNVKNRQLVVKWTYWWNL
ncbi:DUF5916 domain-containing protein [Albibacterium bauzanense]|uniref:Carbohydrate binding protein with CBM9 domain n=1 Tax=Albibacterium bauzanense TaxID=653929 RepID=A0A4R1M7I2_9SPHI|nr:DUF5916 domain-containing protein [Albibacterium bauzanense]TCK85799.1 carbohydrate binding protein with CBM9 domain [Albibacterium bauzanense]